MAKIVKRDKPQGDAIALHGIGGLVPDGFYTRGAVAKMVGKSRRTIQRWHDEGIYKSTNRMAVGEILVWVYSDADIQNMRHIVTNIGHGPNARQKITPVKSLTKSNVT